MRLHPLYTTLLTLASGISASSSHGQRLRHVRKGQCTKRGPDHGPIRGINLGGWLLSEPFITPSLYDSTGNDQIVDEYTMGQYLSPQGAADHLRPHWDTWITQDDFALIKSYGLTHVRLPIGYWSILDDLDPVQEPYARGAYSYVFSAIEWARQNSLKVLIDLHGAPGSQNGFDNSGHKGEAQWATAQVNIERTLHCLDLLAEEFSKAEYSDVIYGIAVLNEPAGFLAGNNFVDGNIISTIKAFYDEAIQTIRSRSSSLQIILHNAYQPDSSWAGYQPDIQLVFDDHYYNMFNVDTLRNISSEALAGLVCAKSDDIAGLESTHSVIVGEFTAAYTDCNKYLNGRGVGARWENDLGRDCQPFLTSNPSTDIIDTMRAYWEIQVDTYERAGGHFYWTWKTESDADGIGWSYSNLVGLGILPADPTERRFAQRCS